MSDLEDGEVVDSDCEETVGKQSSVVDSKNLFSVTHDAGAFHSDQKANSSSTSFLATKDSVTSYRTNRSRIPSASDDDSYETSDEDSVIWNRKRAKYLAKHRHTDIRCNLVIPPFRNPLTCHNGNDKNTKKTNNIWSSVLGEQCLTQGMKKFDVENSLTKDTGDRNVESYDYTKAAHDTRCFLKSNEDDMDDDDDDDPFGGEVVDLEPNEGSGAIQSRKRKHVKTRIGERTFDKSKSRKHINATKDDSTEKIVAALVEHLREPKVQLLNRVVEVLGKEKTLHLLYLTEDIEDCGGMMTVDGSRRRTKGGVFIQLIKSDKHIEKKDVKEIFAEEEKEQKKLLKALAKKRRRQKRRNKTSSHTNSMSVDQDQNVQDNETSRNSGCEDSDDDSCDIEESCPPNSTTGSNDSRISRESGDGASDTGCADASVPTVVSAVNVENFPEEDMLDIMPGDEETIE